MHLNHSLHLAYCTNIHRGESWQETFRGLQDHALAVRAKVIPQGPFAIGLRLSELAARELSDPSTLLDFRRWLDRNSCYVFTINGFPYGRFHGASVKQLVYHPDWVQPERVAYTNLLFDLLAQLLPAGMEGSVSTLPGAFKGDHLTAEALGAIRRNLCLCVEHVARVAAKSGRALCLGLEPEPLCLLECTAETSAFFLQLRAERPRDERLVEHLGLTYDTCHFAVEFEEPQQAIACLANQGIKIAKIHLSSALAVSPTREARAALNRFADDVYLHQVISRDEAGNRTIYSDLPEALSSPLPLAPHNHEWRIHFHVPLHAPAAPPLKNTNSHLLSVLDLLAANPRLCSHLEMETYTWEVLPPELKAQSVVRQLVAEYEWTLAQLRQRGLA